MDKTDYTVFVGRFQPVHIAHIRIIEEALKTSDKVLVLVGSNRSPRTLRNPWTYEERADMIYNSLSIGTKARVTYAPIRDYLYDDLTWITSIQNTVLKHVDRGDTIKMIGHFKDDSSYYLKLFPSWPLQTVPNYYGADSSDIREELFNSIGDLDKIFRICPSYVKDVLRNFRYTEAFAKLVEEYDFIINYRRKWEHSPFPPTFVTTDAIVVQSGHILLIKRGRNPGKGCYALPGGFVSQHEKIFDSCVRELREETGIKLNKQFIEKSLKSSHIFDHPNRGDRGRTITHAYYFGLDHLAPLPTVEAGDDASEAMWMPINDLTLFEENFFSDHLQIISYFIRVL